MLIILCTKHFRYAVSIFVSTLKYAYVEIFRTIINRYQNRADDMFV